MPLTNKSPKIDPETMVIKSVRESDCVINQMMMGIETITATSVPLAPDVIPANQKPINRQIRVANLSKFFEYFQLEKQKIVMPKTAVEKGIGLPENISSLPRKRSVNPN